MLHPGANHHYFHLYSVLTYLLSFTPATLQSLRKLPDWSFNQTTTPPCLTPPVVFHFTYNKIQIPFHANLGPAFIWLHHYLAFSSHSSFPGSFSSCTPTSGPLQWAGPSAQAASMDLCMALSFQNSFKSAPSGPSFLGLIYLLNIAMLPSSPLPPSSPLYFFFSALVPLMLYLCAHRLSLPLGATPLVQELDLFLILSRCLEHRKRSLSVEWNISMNVCHNWNYFIDLFTCLPYIPNVTVNSLESGNISVLFTTISPKLWTGL